jgi:hypothetical protein
MVPSRIGIQLSDGTIQSSFHKHLGQTVALGRNLESYYDTEEKVSNLISGGDMFSCWTNKRSVLNSDPLFVDEFGPDYYSNIGFDLPPQTHQDLNEYLTYASDNNAHYAYVFSDNSWIAYKLIGESSPRLVAIDW